MSTIQTQHRYRVDLDSSPLEVELSRPLSHTDALADEIIVAVRRGTTPVDLTGMTVTGCLTFSTRQTLPLSGSVSGSNAILPMTADCYAIPGLFTLTIQLVQGDVRHTVLRITGQITRSSSENLISSGDLLPTLPDLLEEIGDMHAATENADTAAANANSAARSTQETLGQALASFASAMTAAAPAIQQEAAGSLLTMNDAAARPAVALVSKLTAIQSGTGDPSPDNVRPITGHDVVSLFRTGKNMLGFSDYLSNSSSFTETCENGVFYRTVTAAHATSYLTSGSGMQYLETPHIPAGTYTFTLTHLSGVSLISPYLEVTLPDGSTVQLPNGKATTIAQDGMITGVRMTSKNFSTGDEFSYTLQLESGAGTEYEGYDGVILSADLPETVYGGALDWLTGVLTVTHRKLVIDGETVAMGKVTMHVNNVYYATLMLDKAHNGVISTNKQDGIISSHYVENPLVAAGNCYITGADGDVLVIAPHNQTLTTPELLNAYFQTNPVTFVYKLAEPYDVQLTPQQLELLKGCNTVWSSTGATEVSYIADTKSYIDNAIAAIAASIINV